MKLRRIFKILFFSLLLVVATGVILSALNNLVTPTRSETVERLSIQEKGRIAEIFHLRQSLGDGLWLGWGQASIPLIVYNEEYAFLIGYAAPPSGWIQVPQMSTHEGVWEPVPNETVEGQTYYRLRLPSPDDRPQNFTVMVGDRWVASLQTKEWMFISLSNFFSEKLPPLFRPILPRGFIAQLFVGSSDKYISLALHETFHAYQGMIAPTSLIKAEKAVGQEKNYPYDDPVSREAWQVELNLLAQAVRTESDTEMRKLAQQFLGRRTARRETLRLDAALVDYERQREWLEGLAKYVELGIWRAAATPGYEPSPAVDIDPDFKSYRTFEQNRTQEVNQITLALGSEETLFYYSGMAQAMLLDRLMPDWEGRILRDDVMLEDLLRHAVAEVVTPVE